MSSVSYGKILIQSWKDVAEQLSLNGFPSLLFCLKSILFKKCLVRYTNRLIQDICLMTKWQSRAVLRLLLPGLEIAVIGETADLLEVLNDGQFSLHLHLGAEDLLDEVLGFIEILAERVELAILEEGLEAVNGDAGVAEVFDLLDLVLAQLMDYGSLLQEFGGFSMEVLAEVLGFKAVALLDLGTHVERPGRNFQEFGELVLVCRLTVALLVFKAEPVGGDLYFRRNGFSIVVLVLQALKQAGPGLHEFLALHRMLLLEPEEVHLGLRQPKLVILFPQSFEPVSALRLGTAVKLIREIIVHKTLVRHYFYQYKPSVLAPQQILKSAYAFYYAGNLVEREEVGESTFAELIKIGYCRLGYSLEKISGGIIKEKKKELLG